MSADNGRIREIVRAAIGPDATMDNLVFVVRQVLRRERDDGYNDGYDDGGRDARDGLRYEEERAARAARAKGEGND